MSFHFSRGVGWLGTGLLFAVTVYGLTSCMDSTVPDPSQPSDQTPTATTVVDADYIGAYPSLAVAPDGRLHASYYAKLDWDLPGGGALRHAVLQNGVWTPEVVDGNVYDAAVDVGQFTNLAVDPQGGLHIAYWDMTNKDLKYATLPAGPGQSWIIERVADLDQVCEGYLILHAGAVFIGYCGNGEVLLASKSIGDTGPWSFESVASLGADQGAKASLQFDGSGTLHVAFFDVNAQQIQYTVRQPGSPFPKPVSVATLGSNETRMRLVLDPADSPHIVYYDISNSSLLMHAFISDGWKNEMVAAVGDLFFVIGGGAHSLGYLQIAALVDHLGRLRISYYQGTGAAFGDQDLKHAVWTTGGWGFDTVDSAGDVGRTSAIAEDANGTIHIIYRDSTNNDLRYAYLQP